MKIMENSRKQKKLTLGRIREEASFPTFLAKATLPKMHKGNLPTIAELEKELGK